MVCPVLKLLVAASCVLGGGLMIVNRHVLWTGRQGLLGYREEKLGDEEAEPHFLKLWQPAKPGTPPCAYETRRGETLPKRGRLTLGLGLALAPVLHFAQSHNSSDLLPCAVQCHRHSACAHRGFWEVEGGQQIALRFQQLTDCLCVGVGYSDVALQLLFAAADHVVQRDIGQAVVPIAAAYVAVHAREPDLVNPAWVDRVWVGSNAIRSSSSDRMWTARSTFVGVVPKEQPQEGRKQVSRPRRAGAQRGGKGKRGEAGVRGVGGGSGRHDGPVLSHDMTAAHYLRLKTGRCEREVFGCLFLTTRHRLIRDEEVFHGSIDRNRVYRG